MAKKIDRRTIRSGTNSADEAKRLNEIRRQAMIDFPPDPKRQRLPAAGFAAQIREAREACGLTWYSLAKLAGIPNPATIRDIEYGRDAKLSNIEALAAALGLRFELTSTSA